MTWLIVELADPQKFPHIPYRNHFLALLIFLLSLSLLFPQLLPQALPQYRSTAMFPNYISSLGHPLTLLLSINHRFSSISFATVIVDPSKVLNPTFLTESIPISNNTCSTMAATPSNKSPKSTKSRCSSKTSSVSYATYPSSLLSSINC